MVVVGRAVRSHWGSSVIVIVVNDDDLLRDAVFVEFGPIRLLPTAMGGGEDGGRLICGSHGRLLSERGGFGWRKGR